MKKRSFLSIRLALAMFVITALSINANGQGMYVEFKVTGAEVTGTVKTYSLNGSSRTESEMEIAAAQGRKITTLTIALKDTPNVIYTLNETAKTYTAMATNTSAKPAGANDFEITVLGKEKINNYNCTHIKVLYKTTNKEVEMWTSTEVVNYASLQTVKNKYLDGSEFFKALEAKGAAGFPVRIISTNNGRQFQLDLVTAEKRPIDNSLFSLGGYTKTTAGSVGTNNGYDQQKIDQLKNMTPEQRQQYIEEMKKQMPH